MVHETTEYRRKFRWNSSQKRYQIWKENYNFREARRLLEFHHEPLPWEESDHSCSSSSTDENTYLPPSKLKQKHLNLIRLTEAAKNKTEHKAASAKAISPSPQTHSPFPERETCDVGVQTPNWELLEDEKKLLENKKLKEQELQEVSRRLKEEIAHSQGTLNIVERVIQKGAGSEKRSAKPCTTVEEKFQLPVSKKQESVAGTSFGLNGKEYYSIPSIVKEETSCILPSKKYSTVVNHSSLHDKRQRMIQSKSPFNLHEQQGKVCEKLDKHTFDAKVIKNVLQSSAPKIPRKVLNGNIHLPKSRPYKREGHRVINELRKQRDDIASKWLSDYDNKCRFNVRSAPVHT